MQRSVFKAAKQLDGTHYTCVWRRYELTQRFRLSWRPLPPPPLRGSIHRQSGSRRESVLCMEWSWRDVFFRVSGAAFCRGPRCVCLPGRLTGVGVEKKGGKMPWSRGDCDIRATSYDRGSSDCSGPIWRPWSLGYQDDYSFLTMRNTT